MDRLTGINCQEDISPGSICSGRNELFKLNTLSLFLRNIFEEYSFSSWTHTFWSDKEAFKYYISVLRDSGEGQTQIADVAVALREVGVFGMGRLI